MSIFFRFNLVTKRRVSQIGGVSRFKTGEGGKKKCNNSLSAISPTCSPRLLLLCELVRTGQLDDQDDEILVALAGFFPASAFVRSAHGALVVVVVLHFAAPHRPRHPIVALEVTAPRTRMKRMTFYSSRDLPCCRSQAPGALPLVASTGEGDRDVTPSGTFPG
mgnify:CR=1 FL=1